MATPKELNDARQRERAARDAKSDVSKARPNPGAPAQQQADGQPENARELEDRSSGSAQASTDPDD
jgi:hypothetical protein